MSLFWIYLGHCLHQNENSCSVFVYFKSTVNIQYNGALFLSYWQMSCLDKWPQSEYITSVAQSPPGLCSKLLVQAIMSSSITGCHLVIKFVLITSVSCLLSFAKMHLPAIIFNHFLFLYVASFLFTTCLLIKTTIELNQFVCFITI